MDEWPNGWIDWPSMSNEISSQNFFKCRKRHEYIRILSHKVLKKHPQSENKVNRTQDIQKIVCIPNWNHWVEYNSHLCIAKIGIIFSDLFTMEERECGCLYLNEKSALAKMTTFSYKGHLCSPSPRKSFSLEKPTIFLPGPFSYNYPSHSFLFISSLIHCFII